MSTRLYRPLRTRPVVEPIHQALSEQDLLPKEHLMELGYVTAKLLVKSQIDYGVKLISPVRSAPSWQAHHHPKESE